LLTNNIKVRRNWSRTVSAHTSWVKKVDRVVRGENRKRLQFADRQPQIYVREDYECLGV